MDSWRLGKTQVRTSTKGLKICGHDLSFWIRTRFSVYFTSLRIPFTFVDIRVFSILFLKLGEFI